MVVDRRQASGNGNTLVVPAVRALQASRHSLTQCSAQTQQETSCGVFALINACFWRRSIGGMFLSFFFVVCVYVAFNPSLRRGESESLMAGINAIQSPSGLPFIIGYESIEK